MNTATVASVAAWSLWLLGMPLAAAFNTALSALHDTKPPSRIKSAALCLVWPALGLLVLVALWVRGVRRPAEAPGQPTGRP